MKFDAPTRPSMESLTRNKVGLTLLGGAVVAAFVNPYVSGAALLVSLVTFVLQGRSERCDLSLEDDALVFHNPFITARVQRHHIEKLTIRGNSFVGREIYIQGTCSVRMSSGKEVARNALVLPDAFAVELEELAGAIERWRRALIRSD